MDPSIPRVEFTSLVSDQCARWDCIKVALRSGYCDETCLGMVTSDSRSTRPISLANFFSSTTKFAPVAAKIINLLRTEKECGVPRLSSDLLKTPPWQSNMFGVEFTPREEYFQWLFIGPDQIPISTTDFKWIGGRSKTVGEVRHCVFKPFPREDNRWKLHQYSSPDLIGKAVYVMHCSKSD